MKKVIHQNNYNISAILKGIASIFLVVTLFLKPVIQTVVYSSSDDIELSETGNEEEVEITDVLFDKNIESIQTSFTPLASYSREEVYHFYSESIRFNFILEIITPPPELV